MSKKMFFVIGLLTGVLVAIVVMKLNTHVLPPASTPTDHNHVEVYTCPMHPEIRQSEPGVCPICHMQLVKVSDQTQDDSARVINPATLAVSAYQTSLLNLQPISPKKESVNYRIPTSGRILSSSTLALQVFEQDLRYLKPGVKVVGHTAVFPEVRIEAEVVAVDNFADPRSRTVRVVARMAATKQKFYPETSFIGEFLVPLGEVLTVPEESVLFSGKGSFVYLYGQDELRPQQVVLGPKIENKYVVIEGVSEKDKLSSGPNFLIDSESKIRGLND